MTDSAANVKLATLSMAANRQARFRGGEEGMDRATVGRAADDMPSAILASLASQEALVKANAEAQAQEALRWQRLRQEAQAAARARLRQALNKAREEAREDDAPEEGDGQDSGEADSSARKNAGRSGRKTAAPGSDPSVNSDPPKGVVYTNTGEVKPKAASKKLSVTA